MKKLAVAALGGNALIRGSQSGSIKEQEENAFAICKYLTELIKRDYNLVITHGNGPQVGNILLRNEAGYTNYKVPKMPLDICVADSQGGIGYMIERQMLNALANAGLKKNVITIVSQILVSKDDPAFENPTKPVGAFYLKEEADLLSRVNNWRFAEDPRKRGWRRVVASPRPLDIFNSAIIKLLAEAGNIVITAGGGGIPVHYNENKDLVGIEAVIDKDLTSSLLSQKVEADVFFILTDVPKICINFQKPDEKTLDIIKLADAKKYLKYGEFAVGSMKPKIQAAIDFLENGGDETIITEAAELLNEKCGTRIIKN
jgi:carbamate kinase